MLAHIRVILWQKLTSYIYMMIITSSSDNHHKVIWFTHARHIQAKSNPVHAVMILIMSRDEVFMGRERGKPSWCRIDTYISRKRQFSNNAEIACSRQKREIIQKGLIRMEALEKIWVPNLFIWIFGYLIFKYFVFGTGAREICQRGPLQWAVVG